VCARGGKHQKNEPRRRPTLKLAISDQLYEKAHIEDYFASGRNLDLPGGEANSANGKDGG
jgi:hypothetical protein